MVRPPRKSAPPTNALSSPLLATLIAAFIAAFLTWVLASCSGGARSSSDPTAQSSQKAVLTRNYDNTRSAVNTQETQLTPNTVTIAHFGKLFSYTVDDAVYGQPLYVAGLNIAGKGQHNVIFVATENDTVYAFDADHDPGGPLWRTSLVNAAGNETAVPCDDVQGCFIADKIGVTATPVISLERNAMYVEARSKQNGSYLHKLHALDLTSGAEKFGGPTLIQASVHGSAPDADANGNLVFNPLRENSRPGLLLLNGVVYICFASIDDVEPYHGWVLGYSADTLKQVSVFNATPNGMEGGIWHNNGPAADSNGNIFLVSGNGAAQPSSNNYGHSFLKLTPKGAQLVVADYFTPFDAADLNDPDLDVGSGGALLLPDQSGTPHPHLLVAAGKAGKIYLVNRDNMGKFNPNDDSQIVQSIPSAVGDGTGDDSNFYAPVFWNGNVYFSGNNDVIKAFSLKNGLLSTTPVMQTTTTIGFPGAGLVISANGSSGAILWALDASIGRLWAYDPGNLSNKLWDSDQSGSDSLQDAMRLNVPLVVNGRVYVTGTSTVTVFGLK